MKKKTLEKLRRLTKVLYFVVTIPIVLFACWLSIWDFKIYRWSTRISNYYFWILYTIFIVLWYVLFSDLIRRIARYIHDGSFVGFIDYKKVFTKWIWIPIILIITWIALNFWSNNLRNQCSWPFEQYNDSGICSCEEWYVRNYETKSCEITIWKKIMNAIPQWSFLREIQEVPWNPWYYIGIYITDYTILPEKTEFDYDYNGNKIPLYLDCFSEVEWQWIIWDYFLFTFHNNRIEDTKKIPTDRRPAWSKLTFSFRNSRYNNLNFFQWLNPDYNDINNFTIEPTQLINFRDYNGDGKALEFFMVDHRDQVCGHNNYMIAWFDDSTKNIILYQINRNDSTISYRWDNFIPNSKGEVTNWFMCWDHWWDIEIKNTYQYNSETKTYNLISHTERECTDADYDYN